MLKKLLVALVASAFALGAYAQAPKADVKAEKKKAKARGEVKADAKKVEKAK